MLVDVIVVQKQQSYYAIFFFITKSSMSLLSIFKDYNAKIITLKGQNNT